MENELQNRIKHHRDREYRMQKAIDAQKKEIRRLKKAIRQLVDDAETDTLADNIIGNADYTQGEYGDNGMDCDNEQDSRTPTRSNSDAHSDDSAVTYFAVWDNIDEIYRCVLCSWEVYEGFCEACATEHEVDEEKCHIHSASSSSISTEHQAMNPDRRLKPRGTTPLRDVGNVRELPGYTKDEYHALLARGATKLMCETFLLEFTEENGIIAWADDLLFKAFSGNAMKWDDHWKIYLGRLIELDEDDLDGAQFIEDLLEEILLFPSSHLRGPLGLERAKKHLRWQTAEESPGIWATRPVVDQDDPSDEDDEDSIYSDSSDACFSGEQDITYKTLDEEEDDALEVAMPEANFGPVIEFEEYEDEELDNDEGERVDDALGWTGIYSPEGSPVELAFQPLPEDQRTTLSSAEDETDDTFDSDFDAQQELSAGENDIY